MLLIPEYKTTQATFVSARYHFHNLVQCMPFGEKKDRERGRETETDRQTEIETEIDRQTDGEGGEGVGVNKNK